MSEWAGVNRSDDSRAHRRTGEGNEGQVTRAGEKGVVGGRVKKVSKV